MLATLVTAIVINVAVVHNYYYIALSVLFYFPGTSYLLWTQELLFLHVVLPVTAVCRHAAIFSLPSSPSPDRVSYPVVVMPHSTLTEFVFDRFSCRPRFDDNDDWEK